MMQGFYLAWLQSCAIMVQLEANGWGRVGDDLTPKSENQYVVPNLLFCIFAEVSDDTCAWQ